MHKPALRSGTLRDRNIEALETRIVMSGQSIADFTLNSALERIVSADDPGIDQSLAHAHNQSGLTAAKNAYGFTGLGQTVAVIDSGIAYDHFALGGGYGENFRVVGGWDFAENDANPYDDGYMGSHGTHVAGIVGSEHGIHTGVAPGVDLVGLRVFDDNGNGYFHWVEEALQWVHENRNAFDNPITTVNLSLGAEWNSDRLPAWATLEDEFAQLEADGIFIAVAAGNSFQSYNSSGLGYPAVSEYVVPVSSVDDVGKLSSFSQRHERVIAAPGQGIASTVPDYVGNYNGKTDDFATFSGTSMASPYVAGASVLVRQAYEFVGQSNVTQDQIYDLMRSTADSVWDATTQQSYSRLNLAAALDAIMPTDDYGSTLATAHELGDLATSDPGSLSGILSRLDDVDYFQFTADATGSVRFDATSLGNDTYWVTPNTLPTTTIDNLGGLSFDVVAGESYTIGLDSGGLAHYDLNFELTSSIVDWGTIEFEQFANERVTDGSWYSIEASRDGLLTIEALFANAGGNVDLTLYDSDGNVVAHSTSVTNNERVDVTARAGETFLLKITGSNSDVDFRLTNLVNVKGSTVTVHGTSGDDTINFSAGNVHKLKVNGVHYQFTAAASRTFQINTYGGEDTTTLAGSHLNDRAVLNVGEATLISSNYRVAVTGSEQIHVTGGGGYDTATFYDSSQNDSYVAHATHSSMRGNGYFNRQTGFDRVTAFATTGNDTAKLLDSAGNDIFVAYATHSYLKGDSFHNIQKGFDVTKAYASTGYDKAKFFDSAGNDIFAAGPTSGYLRGAGFYNFQKGFDRVNAYASSGYDQAYLFDSAGNDIFVARPTYGYLRGAGFYNYQKGFDRVNAYASSGYDRATLFDSAGDDTYVARPTDGYLRGAGFYNFQKGFDRVNAYASTGHDQATLLDSTGDDLFVAYATRSYIRGDGFYNYQKGFDRTKAYASSGFDTAKMHDSAGNDTYIAYADRSWMQGSGFYNFQKGFDRSIAYATSGYDKAVAYELSNEDSVYGRASRFETRREATTQTAYSFDRVLAQAIAGKPQDDDVDAVDYLFTRMGDWE